MKSTGTSSFSINGYNISIQPSSKPGEGTLLIRKGSDVKEIYIKLLPPIQQ